MTPIPLTTLIPFNNILYIGDESKACRSVIEKFNIRLSEIEHANEGWFNSRRPKHTFTKHDKLQYHIHYHFEGGVAIFKFRDEEELPADIRNECLSACKNLVAEQFFYLS